MKHAVTILIVVLCAVMTRIQHVMAEAPKNIEARQFLENHKPLHSPAIELGAVDRKERNVAEKLFAAQINALRILLGTKDDSIIPILVTYLHYADPPIFDEIPGHSTDVSPDANAIATQYPAFAVIIRIPTANIVLSKYIKNSKNEADYRIAALHVLRYIDKKTVRQNLCGN